jgi:hypothetical protein
MLDLSFFCFPAFVLNLVIKNIVIINTHLVNTHNSFEFFKFLKIRTLRAGIMVQGGITRYVLAFRVRRRTQGQTRPGTTVEMIFNGLEFV